MDARSLTTRASLWLPPVAYMAVIFYVSAQSDPLPVVTAHVWDKLLHALEYAALGTLFARALFGEGLGLAATFIVAALLGAAYGASDEYHQLLVPMRDPDVQDWIVDVIGAALGAAGYSLGPPSAAAKVNRSRPNTA
jgi:VanZ family protein